VSVASVVAKAGLTTAALRGPQSTRFPDYCTKTWSRASGVFAACPPIFSDNMHLLLLDSAFCQQLALIVDVERSEGLGVLDAVHVQLDDRRNEVLALHLQEKQEV
jgi:hypothetical protein